MQAPVHNWASFHRSHRSQFIMVDPQALIKGHQISSQDPLPYSHCPCSEHSLWSLNYVMPQFRMVHDILWPLVKSWTGVFSPSVTLSYSAQHRVGTPYILNQILLNGHTMDLFRSQSYAVAHKVLHVGTAVAPETLLKQLSSPRHSTRLSPSVSQMRLCLTVSP